MALSKILPASISQPNPTNWIINSDMEVSQRGTSFTTASGYGAYTLDRWMSGHTVTGKFSIAQVADAPTGFKYSLKATSASAYTVGTNEEFVIRQKIEGQNCIPLALGTSSAKTVTLSFWVKSSLTGTFSGAFLNSAENRCYVFTYAISSASTWEKKEISVVLDTSGTWLTTNGIGLTLYFSLGAGSGLQASAGSWISTKDLTTSSSVNLVGTNAATWQITGVVLNEGSHAISFPHESYSENLQKCLRYYQKHLGWVAHFSRGLDSNYDAHVVGAGVGVVGFMRATPTETVANVYRWDAGDSNWTSDSSAFSAAISSSSQTFVEGNYGRQSCNAVKADWELIAEL